MRSKRSTSQRRRSACVGERPFSIRASTGTRARSAACSTASSSRHRDGDLLLLRRVLGVLQRHDEQVRGHEHRLVCARDADRRVEDGAVERSGERHEHAPLCRRTPAAAAGAGRRGRGLLPRRRRGAGRQRRGSRRLLAVDAVRDDADVDARAGSARAPRRASRAGSRGACSRRASRRGRTSIRALATTRLTVPTRSSPSSSRKCAPRTTRKPAQGRELHLLLARQLAAPAGAPRARRAERRAARPSARRAAGCAATEAQA